MYQFPKVHRNCSCKTFWSTVLVQLFERACCLYMPPHFTTRQCSTLCSVAPAKHIMNINLLLVVLDEFWIPRLGCYSPNG